MMQRRQPSQFGYYNGVGGQTFFPNDGSPNYSAGPIMQSGSAGTWGYNTGARVVQHDGRLNFSETPLLHSTNNSSYRSGGGGGGGDPAAWNGLKTLQRTLPHRRSVRSNTGGYANSSGGNYHQQQQSFVMERMTSPPPPQPRAIPHSPHSHTNTQTRHIHQNHSQVAAAAVMPGHSHSHMYNSSGGGGVAVVSGHSHSHMHNGGGGGGRVAMARQEHMHQRSAHPTQAPASAHSHVSHHHGGGGASVGGTMMRQEHVHRRPSTATQVLTTYSTNRITRPTPAADHCPQCHQERQIDISRDAHQSAAVEHDACPMCTNQEEDNVTFVTGGQSHSHHVHKSSNGYRTYQEQQQTYRSPVYTYSSQQGGTMTGMPPTTAPESLPQPPMQHSLEQHVITASTTNTAACQIPPQQNHSHTMSSYRGPAQIVRRSSTLEMGPRQHIMNGGRKNGHMTCSRAELMPTIDICNAQAWGGEHSANDDCGNYIIAPRNQMY